ncbi:hypothetical protein TNCV_509551 [Trichonephila clavipes]|nr:hypothetical protein TNCV_509551 [Trichonephila clavipes]
MVTASFGQRYSCAQRDDRNCIVKVLYEGDTRSRWRDGQVCPDVDKGTMAPWARRLVCFGVLCANRTREVKRDFGDLRIRGEGRVVNTSLVFKRVLFQEKGDRRKKRTRKRGLVVLGSGEENPRVFLFRDADQESKNANER